MGLEFLIPIFGIMIVLVPVTGLTAVLTLRLGGKPFVETLARELRGTGWGGAGELDGRVRELEGQVDSLTQELDLLRAAQAFDRKLIDAGAAPAEEGSAAGGKGADGGAATRAAVR